MINKKHDVMAQAVVEFTRNGLAILSEKYGGDCTLNEVRVMIQIIRCHLEGQTCSVTALHKVTDIPIPTVSRAVANLQCDGWLSERPDPTDGRKRLISFGPRSLQTTPDDIERSIQWINDFRKNGLPG
jgi:DNA-binding MarR family transcriptional regulator